MASFDAVVRFLMRGDIFNSVYSTFEWAVMSPSRSIFTTVGAGVGSVGAGIGAALRAVRTWIFGGAAGDDVPAEPTSSEVVASSSTGGLNEISEMGLDTAPSCQSLNSSYYSAADGDSRVYLLAPSTGNSQEDVGAGGETAV